MTQKQQTNFINDSHSTSTWVLITTDGPQKKKQIHIKLPDYKDKKKKNDDDALTLNLLFR